jgi:hypothetical protein
MKSANKRKSETMKCGVEEGNNYSFIEKIYYIFCIMIERGIKEIIGQLLFLVNKCLQFLSLFLSKIRK